MNVNCCAFYMCLIIAELLSKASNRDALSLRVYMYVYMYITTTCNHRHHTQCKLQNVHISKNLVGKEKTPPVQVVVGGGSMHGKSRVHIS